MMKICTKCKVEKPVGDFTSRKSSPMGRGPICKLCTAAKVRQRLEKRWAKEALDQARGGSRLTTASQVTKICQKCLVFKPLDNFSPNRANYSGRASYCKPCGNAYRSKRREDPADKVYVQKYNREYRAPRLDSLRAHDREIRKDRQAWLNSRKSSPCARCGETFPPVCMDFDHIRGDKIHSVGAMLTSKMANLEAEIAKCALLCSCCHRMRTQEHLGVTSNTRMQLFRTRVSELKANKPCADCGRILAPVAMDFDHVRGLKFREVSAMQNFAWPRVLAEIAKCELVCANCHRIRTQARKRAAKEVVLKKAA